MPRIATYDKRRMTGKRMPRNRALRPKTFKTEVAAKTYAEANSLKNYKLVDICTSENKQKIKIVLE
ncbi:hypothetical protein H8D83_01175 [Candidatus Woesearchaeota archaeon]|nr:hypothetical protein [Candidatus Woesearchaeota archaeon]